MVPRALFTGDKIWFIGVGWGPLTGWIQLMSMYIGRTVSGCASNLPFCSRCPLHEQSHSALLCTASFSLVICFCLVDVTRAWSICRMVSVLTAWIHLHIDNCNYIVKPSDWIFTGVFAWCRLRFLPGTWFAAITVVLVSATYITLSLNAAAKGLQSPAASVSSLFQERPQQQKSVEHTM